VRVVVFGAGGVGMYLGSALATQHDVTLIGRRENVDAICSRGLIVRGLTERTVHLAASVDLEGVSPPDLLLLTVKSYDTAEAIEVCRSWTLPHTKVLSVQNGLGNVEALDAWIGPRAFGGVASFGVTWEAPGQVRHAGAGMLVVGTLSGSPDAVREIVELLRSCGLEAEPTDNLLGELWGKVIINAAINPLTALVHRPNGYLLENPSLRTLMEGLSAEAWRVAEASGIRLPSGDWVERTRRVAAATAQNRSSMLQDLERGRRTEIEAITGEVVRQARALGVSVPLNESILHLLLAAERGQASRQKR